MSKPRKDRIREERIRNEAVVDAYRPEEQVMGWYYYLENKLRFPFQAKCIASMVVSPLRKGEAVEVRRLAPEDVCTSDMLVLIRWQGRNLAVPWAELALRCGYYDQSHFANDFRAFPGINPTTYSAHRGRWQNHVPIL